MKVTITDPKQEKAPLKMEDLPLGTLFITTFITKRNFTGLIVRGGFGEVNVVWLDSFPSPRTINIKNSTLKDAPVTIIKTVELSSEKEI